MDRTSEDLAAAITRIREFAANYKGKRQAFFDALYLVLVTPIPEGEGDGPEKRSTLVL